MKLFRRNISLNVFSLILSVYTLIAYHFPFYKEVIAGVGGLNGILIFLSLIALMLTLNYMIYYLVLFMGRIIGKCVIGFLFIANAISFYFISSYEVLITSKMMGNVFNTRYSEVSGFISWEMLFYIVVLGVIPCIYVFIQKIGYGNCKRFLTNIGISLGICLIVAFANMTNWPWIDRNATTLGSLLMPWSYTINTIRWHSSESKKNRKEIILPDATVGSDSKEVCVLIIGESARRKNFSLYGYERCTNPLLERDSVTALMAESAATYTTAGVKAILEHKPSDKLYEILPNYLHRCGVNVSWRTSNWGEPPVHIPTYLTAKKLSGMFNQEKKYDEILLAGLEDFIRDCNNDKMLIIIHTSTSHGPAYNKKYPSSFEMFKPVSNTVEMSKAKYEELVNAYDNTILYTDWLVHSTIEILQKIPERRSCMIFVSDHGESLGENNLYMHGVPMSVAPKEQTEIPFIVWTSDKSISINPEIKASQYHIFHSILHFLDIKSPIYNPELDIFQNNS
ncbi:MAG: phosphoethanolamine--lipid A transferase EptA [Odoribacter sp.]|nr:phosphoethanolamine--lipid A transferase EptA [Odoribacter sp.]